MKKRENGFSAVKLILMIIIFGLIALVGWLFYDKINPSSKSNQNSSTQVTTISQNQANKYLEISEWSVKLPLLDNTKLTYSLEKEGKLAYVRSEELDKISGECTSNSVAVNRGRATDKLASEVNDNSGLSFESQYNQLNRGTSLNTRSIKAKIDDYYFLSPSFSGASCVQEQALQNQEDKAMMNIVKSINSMVKL